MKLKLTLAATLLAMASNLSAATYLVSNVVAGGSTDVLVANTNGTLLNGGVVAIGYFNGGAPSSSLANIATTISNFQLQTSILAGSFAPDLEGLFAGYYQQAAPFAGADILAANPLIGQGVYMFTGNAATLAASTAWSLVKVGTYIADNPPLLNQYTANASAALTPANIVFGTVGSAANPLGGTSSTFNLVTVPEPSAALLGALGALGLLRRRRI